jgi:hypothetical protein
MTVPVSVGSLSESHRANRSHPDRRHFLSKFRLIWGVTRGSFLFHRAGIITAIALMWTSGTNASDLIGMSARDVTTREYDSKDFTILVAQVHAARLFTDYEKHGFFRIGLLPIPVAEDVQIEVRSVDGLTNALSGLHFLNEPSWGVRRLELRNLAIKSFDEKQPCLFARLAHVGEDTLELSDISITNVGGGPISIPRAILQITDSSAGWITWKSGGHSEGLFLFKPISDKKL